MHLHLAAPTLLSAVAVSGSALLLAPSASAVPECVNVSELTTQCQTGGSTQIVTTPPQYPPYALWWGFGFFPFGI